MYKHLIYILLFGQLFSKNIWAPQSAYLMPDKRWEVGLFHPFRYGLSDKINYSIHPALFFIMPNLSIKLSHYKSEKKSTASRHSVYYPTKLLKMLKAGVAVGDKTASLIPPGFIIPHMIGFSSDYVFTKIYSFGEASFYGGINLGVVIGDLDERTTIDLPLVYHRLGVFYNQYGIDLGVDFSKALTRTIGGYADLDLKLLPGFVGSYSIEHKFLFSWEKSKKTRVSFGYKFVYGKFPYGNQARILPFIPLLESWVPMVDIQWAGSAQNIKK